MRELPVTKVIDHSVRSTLNHFAFAVHVSWPWLLVILPFHVAANLYINFNMPENPNDAPVGVALASTGIGLLTAIVFSSIAVSWHRYVLLDEIPQGIQRLRLDWTVWRYFGNTILIVLLMFVVGFPVGLVLVLIGLFLGEASLIVIVPAMIALMLAALVYSYRLGVKLPAVALERSDYRFKNALADTMGNFWRFVGLGVVVILIFIAALVAIGGPIFLLSSFANAGIEAVLLAVQLVANWIITIWGVTLLTSLYGYFAEKRDF